MLQRSGSHFCAGSSSSRTCRSCRRTCCGSRGTSRRRGRPWPAPRTPAWRRAGRGPSRRSLRRHRARQTPARPVSARDPWAWCRRLPSPARRARYAPSPKLLAMSKISVCSSESAKSMFRLLGRELNECLIRDSYRNFATFQSPGLRSQSPCPSSRDAICRYSDVRRLAAKLTLPDWPPERLLVVQLLSRAVAV